MCEIQRPNVVSSLHSTFREFKRYEIARDIKETTLKIAETSVAMDKTSKGSSLYYLPDRTQIDLSTESTSLPELILKGSKAGSTTIADTIFQVVEACPAEIRRSLMSNVVVQQSTLCSVECHSACRRISTVPVFSFCSFGRTESGSYPLLHNVTGFL